MRDVKQAGVVEPRAGAAPWVQPYPARVTDARNGDGEATLHDLQMRRNAAKRGLTCTATAEEGAVGAAQPWVERGRLQVLEGCGNAVRALDELSTGYASAGCGFLGRRRKLVLLTLCCLLCFCETGAVFNATPLLTWADQFWPNHGLNGCMVS